MLILTRRVGESVMIGDDVTITVLGVGVKEKQVRLAIKGLRLVAVHREESYERIKREDQRGGSEDDGRDDSDEESKSFRRGET